VSAPGSIWGERQVLNGSVDFSMMYAAHDAFSRDLRRLAVAYSTGSAGTPATRALWATFEEQLHLHHRMEDEALWPPLRAAVGDGPGAEVLDAMAAEHAEIDPCLEAIDDALQGHDLATLGARVRAATSLLGNHMRHEENAALPLVETHLGPAGWAAFGRHIRKAQGLRGAATYLPWLLDDMPTPTAQRVLSLLPPPARVLYRRVWLPRYRRSHA
jgi:hypothetical protein